MNKTWFSLTVLLLLIVVGCRQEEITPEAVVNPTFVGRAFQVQEVSLLTLLRNKSRLQGTQVRVAGQYKALPVQVCATEVRRSPATWSLTDEGSEVLAGGFDDPLRELAGRGVELTVQGRWMRWEGPVGCGRRTLSQEIWYLDVSEIISPNPLFVTGPLEEDVSGTPAVSPPEGTDVAGIITGGTPVAGLTAPSGLTPGAGGPGTLIPTATPRLTVTASPTGPTTTPSPSLPATGGTVTLTPTGQVNVTPSPFASPSPTTQGTPQTLTATANPEVTLTLTAVPGGGEILMVDDFEKQTLGAGQSQQWDFTAESGDVTTVSAAPSSSLDLSLLLFDVDGNLIVSQNQGSVGQPESIGEIPPGDYQLLVAAIGNSSGQYTLTLLSAFSEPFLLFREILLYGASGSGSLPQNADHIWSFEGQAGDIITIRVTALTDNDLLFYLNDPDGDDIEFEDDDDNYGPPNDVEELVGYELPMSGMYSIGVGEAAFNSASYTIIVRRG